MVAKVSPRLSIVTNYYMGNKKTKYGWDEESGIDQKKAEAAEKGFKEYSKNPSYLSWFSDDEDKPKEKSETFKNLRKKIRN